MKNFRLLRADEIECRINQINDSGLSLLLYKTARTDADLLDETVGADNWQNDFKLVDGVLYGGIGIKFGDNWVWKWDAGTESNTEAEKGRASDAFKRAGFKHGIGRELYSSPRVFIYKDKCNIKLGRGNKYVCYDNFVVSKIEYENERVSKLEISLDGEVVFDFDIHAKPKKKQSKPEPKPEPPKPADEPPVSEPPVDKYPRCSSCGFPLVAYTGKDGKDYLPRQHAELSRQKFGKVLCIDCIRAGKR